MASMLVWYWLSSGVVGLVSHILTQYLRLCPQKSKKYFFRFWGIPVTG